MDLGLNNKVALVAASSKGLGYGVAKALAANGARVSLCSRSAEDVAAAAETIAAEYGVETLATACDVRAAADIQAWVDKTVAAWGAVDCLLVNAGGPPAKTIMEVSEAEFQAAFELTLLSSFRIDPGDDPAHDGRRLDTDGHFGVDQGADSAPRPVDDHARRCGRHGQDPGR